LQAQYTPVRKVNITLGARYDINSRYGNSFNPRLGIAVKPFNKTTIKFLYGSAFLAPSASDSYAQYGSFDTQDSGKTYHSYFLHLPNPGLKPITSQNTELSIRQYLTDNISITADGYYTVLRGLHEFADDNTSTKLYNNTFQNIPVDYIEVFVNQSKQTNYGGSLQLNWKWALDRARATSYASLSYVNGKIDNALTESEETAPAKELEFISPFMFRLGTDLKAGKFSVAPRLTLMGKQHLAGISDTAAGVWKRQTLAGYTLLNVSVRYNIIKHLSVFVNVTNALNQKYRNVSFNMDLNKSTDALRGQPQDPIRVMGGLNYSF
ncbi:MAG: TonB-dependent receptor, partial [Bacteroidota bacterium]